MFLRSLSLNCSVRCVYAVVLVFFFFFFKLLSISAVCNIQTMTHFLPDMFINVHVLTHIADADAMATAELWE